MKIAKEQDPIEPKQLFLLYLGPSYFEGTKKILYKFIPLDSLSQNDGRELDLSMISMSEVRHYEDSLGVVSPGSIISLLSNGTEVFSKTSKHEGYWKNQAQRLEWSELGKLQIAKQNADKELKKIKNEELMLDKLSEIRDLYRQCTGFEQSILTAKIFKYLNS